jgi:arsenate reductase (thioredoxin)
MEKIKVLFVCVHNSARSQMAETLLNHLAGERFRAESAGFEPTKINHFVVEVMKEIGFDISKNQTKSVFDLFKQGRLFDYVIAVCDAANGERCPIFPSVTKRLNWSIEDPSSFRGTHEEILSRTRLIRDKIKIEIENFINHVDFIKQIL